MRIVPTNFIQWPLCGSADELYIRVEPFDLFPTEITIFWQVKGDGVNKEGKLVINETVINQWGTDDTIVKNYVLQQLNLTEDTTPEPDPNNPVLQQLNLTEDTTPEPDPNNP